MRGRATQIQLVFPDFGGNEQKLLCICVVQKNVCDFTNPS